MNADKNWWAQAAVPETAFLEIFAAGAGFGNCHETLPNLHSERGTCDSRFVEVLHWYDFICPNSYIGQHRNAILVERGCSVVQLPFQSHHDVPAEGLRVESRNGPMYTELVREAKASGLRLNWSTYFPNSRGALACAEWVRLHQPDAFPRFHKTLFDAHFLLGENVGSPEVIFRHATDLGIDLKALQTALADGSAGAALRESEARGRKAGVKVAPAWLIGEELITGLRPAEEFERLAAQGSGTYLTA
jgi:predicted DsbA family dithiol-disulfide isomerase